MGRKYVLLLFMIALLLITTNMVSCSEFDIVRDNRESWDCVSYTVDYCRTNPDYVPCSISRFSTFRYSHMVAVKIIDNDTLEIEDGTKKAHYTLRGLQYTGEYYHLWINEPVLRNWGVGRVRDNRIMIE